MNMIEKKLNIEICDLDAVADCKMANYGEMRDSCSGINANLVGGNVYAVLGEFGTGGWALSYILSGNKGKYDFISNGSIKVNGKQVSHNELKSISYYVGSEGNRRKWFGMKEVSVLEQLTMAAKGNRNIDVNRILDEFQLSNERLNRSLQQLSGEKWNASMAIGFALRKKIYCFPWLNTGWIYRLKPRLQTCFDLLKKDGAIIILPTAKEEAVKDIADVMILTKGSNDI